MTKKLAKTTAVKGSNGNVYSVKEYTCLDDAGCMFFKITCTCKGFAHRGECKHIDKILDAKQLPFEIADRYDYPVNVQQKPAKKEEPKIDENLVKSLSIFLQDNLRDDRIYFTKKTRLTNAEFYAQNPNLALKLEHGELDRIKNDIHQYSRKNHGDYNLMALDLMMSDIDVIFINNTEYTLNDICK